MMMRGVGFVAILSLDARDQHTREEHQKPLPRQFDASYNGEKFQLI